MPRGSFHIFKVCSDAKDRVGCRKQREATAAIQSLVKLQSWFLSLRWKTCLRQNCSLGSCACSEWPALEQNTLMISALRNPFPQINIFTEPFKDVSGMMDKSGLEAILLYVNMSSNISLISQANCGSPEWASCKGASIYTMPIGSDR